MDCCFSGSEELIEDSWAQRLWWFHNYTIFFFSPILVRPGLQSLEQDCLSEQGLIWNRDPKNHQDFVLHSSLKNGRDKPPSRCPSDAPSSSLRRWRRRVRPASDLGRPNGNGIRKFLRRMTDSIRRNSKCPWPVSRSRGTSSPRTTSVSPPTSRSVIFQDKYWSRVSVVVPLRSRFISFQS